MKFLVVVLSALAVAAALDDGVFRFSTLKGLDSLSVRPVYSGSYAVQPILAHQPAYTNVFSKYVQPAVPAYWQHAPSTYSSSLVEKYHHAPVYSSVALAPHYVEKFEKVHQHVPLVLAHPAVTSYAALPKPTTYQYVEKLHPTTYAAAYSGPQFRILQHNQEIDPTLGAYSYNYATENGIQASEQATVKGVGPEGPVAAKQGSYSYTGPDGVVYTVNWIADENGYRASGAHLPQVPEEIKRSLEFNAQHPSIEGAWK